MCKSIGTRNAAGLFLEISAPVCYHVRFCGTSGGSEMSHVLYMWCSVKACVMCCFAAAGTLNQELLLKVLARGHILPPEMPHAWTGHICSCIDLSFATAYESICRAHVLPNSLTYPFLSCMPCAARTFSDVHLSTELPKVSSNGRACCLCQ